MSLIDYGKITKSHGLAGGMKIHPFSGEAAALASVGRIFIKPDKDSEPQSFDITDRVVGEKSAIVKLSGVDTKERAENFCGMRVMVSVSDLPETVEGEYYNFQLVGLLAVRGDGREIGTVESVLQSGFQSVLVISTKGGSGELLVPMVEKFVAEISLEKRTATLKNTEFLR